MSRHLRNFAVFRRQFSRGNFPSGQHGDVRFQRVRILRPLFRYRTLPQMMFTLGVVGFAWLSLERRRKGEKDEQEESVSMKEAVDQVRAVRQTEQLGPGRDVSAGTEDGVEAVPEGEDEAEWEDEELVPEKQPDDAWFIPLWFAQELPRVYYTAEDEEFQAYVKFHDNSALVTQTKMRLLGAIHQAFSNSRDFQRSLGAPILIGKTWLEVEYPDGPPPEYERLGIEVADEYIALLYRPVEQRNYSRLRNTLLPFAAAESFFWSTRTLFQLQLGRLEKLLDETIDGYQSDRGGPRDGQTPPDADEGKHPSKPLNRQRQVSALPLPDLPDPHEDLKRSVHILRMAFARKAKVNISPPRGTVLLAGWVEFVGKHGVCVARVQAIFDPKESKFQTINVTPQRPTRRRLTPKE